jgi:hypothetical protein
MPQQTSELHDESAEAAVAAPTTLREYVTNVAINTVPPLIAYYVLRAFGVVPYLALVGAIAVSSAQALLTMVRKRKFEPLNAVMILGSACSLTIALVTKNPRVVQAIELIPVSVFVWSLAVSGLLGKPASRKLTGAIVPGLADKALSLRGWSQQDIHDWHKLHTRLCVRLGLLCGLFPCVALVWIFTLPVDISQLLIVAIGPTLIVVCISAAVALLRRFVREHDQQAGERASRAEMRN